MGTLAADLGLAPVTTPQRVVKVFFAIPTMGYTDPLAYDNRLLWSMRMGVTGERARWVHRLLTTDMPDLLRTALLAGEEIGAVETYGIRYEMYLGTVGKLLTPYAREVLAEKAVQAGMDLVFMVDDDMLGDPDVFFQLAANVVDGPADICGALAFTRNPPHDPVLYTCLDGRDPIDGAYFVNTIVKRYPKDALVEVDAVGFGAVVFRTALLAKMKRPWFMSTCGSGEDIFFCYKAKRDAGARIFSDTRVKLGHVGNAMIVTEETYETCTGVGAERARDGDDVKYPWAVMR